jgi:hypothetical protein
MMQSTAWWPDAALSRRHLVEDVVQRVVVRRAEHLRAGSRRLVSVVKRGVVTFYRSKSWAKKAAAGES